MKDYCFDDLKIGDRFETERIMVTEDDIVGFARQFDPQPFHTDRQAAAESDFGGIVASGFHMLSLSFGLFFRTRVIEKHNLGSPGMDHIRWFKPLRPDDTIYSTAEVTDLKPSRSRPDRGSVWMRHDTINQKGEIIMSVDCIHRLRRRPNPA